jgi:N-acyl-D-amino-acid deacylase
MTDPYELTLELLRDDNGRTGMVGFGMSDENTTAILSHPLGMICSDGGARATSGPLSEGTPHPRTYGSFPRILGHYVRDHKTMTLETAVHKMSYMPAKLLKLGDRGLLAEGKAADIVVFDPATVKDNSTFENPHQYPTGISHVLVNGTPIVKNQERLDVRSGRVLAPKR